MCVCVSLRATSQPIKEMRFVHAILVFGLLSTCFQMAPCDDSQDERYSTNETVTASESRRHKGKKKKGIVVLFKYEF